MISIVILAILFTFGVNYFFVDIWKEHRISSEKYYLQREAQFALNFIVNGANNPFTSDVAYRFSGMIGSHEIDPNGEKGKKIIITSGLDPNKNQYFSGCIHPFPLNDPNSLVFFKDSCDQTINSGYVIIPHELSSDSNNDPYKVYIDCYKEPNNNSLYTVIIKLSQKKYGRDITIQMQSSVILRNTNEMHI